MSYQQITDFGLNEDGDEYADATGLAMTGDLDGIRQQVMLRLRIFRGEWFLDEEAGLPWYEEIPSQESEPNPYSRHLPHGDFCR